MIKLKTCTKCGVELPLTEFYADKRNKDGVRGKCKACYLIRDKERRDANPEAFRNNHKKWRINNQDTYKEGNKRWVRENPDRVKEINKRWRKNNPETMNANRRKFAVKLRKTIKGKLQNSISGGINHSLKSGSKACRHWETLVGYTVNELKLHLEKNFLPGMSWGNYGCRGWHIDHKIPVSAFNFEIPEDIDFGRCWALGNLQPLWAKDNLVKYNKLDKTFQPSLRLSA